MRSAEKRIMKVFFLTLVALHLENYEMPLHDTVGVNCRKCITTKIRAQVPSIWAKG